MSSVLVRERESSNTKQRKKGFSVIFIFLKKKTGSACACLSRFKQTEGFLFPEKKLITIDDFFFTWSLLKININDRIINDSFLFQIIDRPYGCICLSMLSIENQTLLSNNSFNNELYCPALFDNLCWPKTRANHSVTISCSPLAMQGVDSMSSYSPESNFLGNISLFNLEFITRQCLSGGNWSTVSYKSCVYPDVWDLMMTFYIKRTVQQRKVC
jgi:hypothetical protein